VLDQLTWQMQRSGLLTATARLVAQGETVGTTTSAGTPAELDLSASGISTGRSRATAPPLGNVVSAEITYANNLDRIETIRSDGRIDGADPSMPRSPAGSRCASPTSTLVTQAINGEPCEMEFAYTPPPAKASPSPRTPSTCRARASRFPGRKACRPASTGRRRATASLGRMCTATLVNDVETLS
jgi:hypothetical protein